MYSIGSAGYALPAFPGYSYTRSGSVGFVNASGGVEFFGANVPPILSGIGYEAYAAATNMLLDSQNNGGGSWSSGNYQLTPTANTTVAPDGTTTADTLTFDVDLSNNTLQAFAVTAGQVRTASFFVKRGTSTALKHAVYDATNAAYIVPATSHYSSTNGSTFTRIVITYTVPALCTLVWLAPAINCGSGTAFYWQAQDLLGNYPDGGPIIATAGSAASIGEGLLTLDDTVGADADQLFVAKGVINNAYGILTEWSDGVGGNVVGLFQHDGVAEIRASISGVTMGAGLAYTMGDEVTVVLRRLSGDWRLGKVQSGVLTWAASVTGAFPTGLTQVNPGNSYAPDGVYLNDAIQFVGRKVGAFTSDAAVLAAVAGI